VLAEKGLTIETTLNADWQVAAEKAVKDAVELMVAPKDLNKLL
jgi:membrane peptidoglycan carboxypeptidase